MVSTEKLKNVNILYLRKNISSFYYFKNEEDESIDILKIIGLIENV